MRITLTSLFGMLAMTLGLQAKELPVPLETYADARILDVWKVIQHRIDVEPFNWIATLIFVLAIVHTFAAGYFRHWAHLCELRHENHLRAQGKADQIGSVKCFKSQVLHLLGEVEAIFLIWTVPLFICMAAFYGIGTVLHYVDHSVNYNEAIFVMVIMTIAGTRPILTMAERCMYGIAQLGNGSALAWWLGIMTFAPLLGSFITEPAAMTIAALLLGTQFYSRGPSSTFQYATLGLLFVNISIGGTLTHFAAPPILMIATKWNWGIAWMLRHFGFEAMGAIVLNNLITAWLFRNEWAGLTLAADTQAPKAPCIPCWVTAVHVGFLAFTVLCLHHTALYVGGFLCFLAFLHATPQHQAQLSLRMPVLVGAFLAGLVTHGTLQGWWIEPILGDLSENKLFFGSMVLTAFNDNAAITYLASLVPAFAHNTALQLAVAQGAVIGGGLTVIANAPNPAGQAILSRYFGKDGISPLKLLLGALGPTIVTATVFIAFG